MSENFFAYFVLFFYLIPIMLVVPIIRKRRRFVNTLLEHQRMKRNGTVKKILGIPYYLEFPMDGQTVTLSLSHGSRNSPECSLFRVNMSSASDFVVTVRFEDAVTKFGKKFGLKDIQVMSPEFDEAFLVGGLDEHRVRAFLDTDVQHTLMDWKALKPSLTVSNKSLEFRVYQLIKDDETLDRFIDAGQKLLVKRREFI